MARSPASPKVHKFGGAALADTDAIRHAVRIVAAGKTRGTTVVVSAMDGVTETLLEIARLARGDRAAAAATSEKLRKRHLTTAAELALGDELLQPLRDTIDREFDDLATLRDAIAALSGSTSLAIIDAIVARGERIAACLVAAALSSAGVPAEVVDATLVVHADGRHGNAAPDFARTAAAVSEHIYPILNRGTVPVVAGFIASGPDGSIVTLGRGGSDLTATLLGRALGARTVTLEGRAWRPDRRSARRTRCPIPAAPSCS